MSFVRITIICFLLVQLTAFSQTLPSRNFTVNDGLPSNSIHCIFKDSKGYLWIGTDAGLCKYDGVNFQIFNQINEIFLDKIWSIAEDSENNLWLSVYGKGLVKFNGNSFKLFNSKDGLINEEIRKLHYSKKHKCIIAATEDGLSIFDGKQFKSFSKIVPRKFQIMAINETPDNILITSSHYGVYNLNIKDKLAESTLDSAFQIKMSYSAKIWNGKYYCGDVNQQLISSQLPIQNIKNNYDSIKCPIIWDMQPIGDSTLYLATWNVNSSLGGLFKYKNGKLIDYTKVAGITSTALWCLYYDNLTNLLWVGSTDKGLYKVDLSNSIQYLEATYFGLNELEIQCLFTDSANTTYIGAKDKLIKLFPDLSYKVYNSAYFAKQEKVIQKLRSKDGDEALPAHKINEALSFYNITSDKNNNTWLSTNWGAFCISPKVEVKAFKTFEGGQMIFDNKNNLNVSMMYSTFYRYSNVYGEMTRTIVPIENQNIPRDIIKTSSFNNEQWFGSYSSGLYVSNNNSFKKINFIENQIKELKTVSGNQMLIGTNSGNVYVAKPSGDTLLITKTFLSNQVIIGNTISFIEEYNGTYFIGTNKGISIIKRDSFYKFINQSEGLSDIQFTSSIKDKTGNIYIGTTNRLLKINANALLNINNNLNNKISLQYLKLSSEKYLNTDSLLNISLTLNYTQNELEFSFENINLFNPSKNLYRNKIIGLSESWTEFSPDNKILLRSLRPGNYTLIIEGKNIGNGNTLIPLSITFTIAPPFWKTKLFYLAIAFALGLLLYIIYSLRIKSIRKREKEKAELANKLSETRLEALRAQMNPHFTFNAINSIQNFIIDNNTEEALHYLSEFSKLIRQTLETASEKLMPLNSELNFLNSYITVQKMRFDYIKTKITVANDIDKYNTQIPPLIIQPFIENVFEHAFGTECSDKECWLEVSFYKQNDLLICTISDNGKGIEPLLEKKHKSKGLHLTRERLNLLNKEYNSTKFNYEISNSSNEKEGLIGTKVTVTLPLILS